MTRLKFKIYLEYDPEYQGFVVDCPTLPGCMSQGKTEKEALTNIKEAIRGCLKTLKAKKQPIMADTRVISVGV